MKIHPKDNVAVVTVDIPTGGTVSALGEAAVEAVEPIPMGHKVALVNFANEDPIVKCGEAIGIASTDIQKGAWVHTHNVGPNPECRPADRPTCLPKTGG